jgi:uncharacterized protein (DUF1800 family)
MPGATIKRLLVFTAAAMAGYAASPAGETGAAFETKLTPEQKLEQAVSRLTYGARPGEIEEVRKLGLEKWIELQLHPERIAENPTLDQRLKPLETLAISNERMLKEYFPTTPPALMMMQALNRPLFEIVPSDKLRKINNGTAEERRATIMALEPELRERVLSQVGDNVVEGLPDLQKMRTEARDKVNKLRQEEQRKLRPPLTELLTVEQLQTTRNGSREEKEKLLKSLDPAKLEKVLAVIPPAQLADLPELRREATMERNPSQVVLDDVRDAKLLRAIYSKRQLQEVLVDFWFNHFNVYEAKNQTDLALIASYERDAIRPHVLGKFKDLLLAVARHPAMLYYLDNWESMSSEMYDIGPFAPTQFQISQPQQLARARRGLNENYGRELLELHTLGVNGGYTQADVIAVAKCFTGWSIRQPFQNPEFAFASFMHDASEKTVLGHKIAAGGGESDGLQVIDIVAHHPSTARFISTKLARRFVADEPPSALIDAMARTFLKTDGDLRAVMETMIQSREFSSQGAWQAKVKSPLEVVAGAARALDADVIDASALALRVSDLGEPLYHKEPPTGYKDTADTWLSTASVMARIKFASDLVNNRPGGVTVDLKRLEGKERAQIARELLGREPSATTMAAIDQGLDNHGAEENPKTLAALVLSAPEFQRR